MLYIYLGIIALLIILILWNMYEEEELFNQIDSALVLIPLVLRLLLIK